MRTILSIAILSIAVAPVVAHHAFSAEFDADRPMQLQGTVTKTEWINPHSWIHIEVKATDGTLQNWAIECGAPNAASCTRNGIRSARKPWPLCLSKKLQTDCRQRKH